MMFHNLSSRIVIFFSLLFTAVLAFVFLLVTTSSYQITRQQNMDDLKTGERVFHRLIAQNRQQLIQSAQVLTADFGFRDAVSSNDTDTIVSALQNHRQRIGADIMMLFSLTGEQLASTLDTVTRDYHPLVEGLIHNAEAKGSAASILKIGNQAFDVVVVPVLAPDAIAWVALGFEINDAFAQDLGALTSLQVTFLQPQLNGHWLVFASTQPVALHAVLEEALSKTNSVSPLSATTGISVPGYETLLLRLTGTPESVITVLLQRSIAEAVARFNNLRKTLLLLSVFSLIAILFGGIFIARRITRPINALATLAQRMQNGDYSQTAGVFGYDEINAFAMAFNHMRDAIVARESEIRHLAYEDSLTSLPNRMLFNDRLDQLCKISKRNAPPFAVLMMDLDRFKYVNDTLGHEAGDQLLAVVAGRVNTILRDSDTVARLGGDEFAILLTNSNPHRIHTVVHRIQSTLEENITIAGQLVDVSCSIGIAIFPEHGNDSSSLLRCSDIAMYVAKRAHSGYAIYDPSYDEHRRDHLHLLGELRKALDENEFTLVFQPKVALTSGNTVGVEALIRWQHPARGLILPGEFIPFAEQTGAIRMITPWLIDKAVRTCSDWLRTGISLQISLNISARDLLNKELPNMLRVSLDKFHVPPHMICVEITESSLMEDPVNAENTLLQLRQLDVGLAIDDYGTGYSSLAYIKKLPFNELKIDRTFIMNMTSHKEDIAIVRSTIELGHNLNLRVVAEGVENDAELELLRQLKCDQAQGYIISKPMPPENIAEWLQNSAWHAQNVTM